MCRRFSHHPFCQLWNAAAAAATRLIPAAATAGGPLHGPGVHHGRGGRRGHGRHGGLDGDGGQGVSLGRHPGQEQQGGEPAPLHRWATLFFTRK